MWRSLLATRADPVGTLLRLGLGVVMFPHGAQKVLGWFGGAGPDATIASFGQAFSLPPGVAVTVMVSEFVGSVLLIVGLLTRVAALAIMGVMLGAMLLVHAPNGFFMDWANTNAGEGFEFHLLALAIGAAVVLTGGGWLSVDRRLTAPRPQRYRAPVERGQPALTR